MLARIAGANDPSERDRDFRYDCDAEDPLRSAHRHLDDARGFVQPVDIISDDVPCRAGGDRRTGVAQGSRRVRSH